MTERIMTGVALNVSGRRVEKVTPAAWAHVTEAQVRETLGLSAPTVIVEEDKTKHDPEPFVRHKEWVLHPEGLDQPKGLTTPGFVVRRPESSISVGKRMWG